MTLVSSGHRRRRRQGRAHPRQRLSGRQQLPWFALTTLGWRLDKHSRSQSPRRRGDSAQEAPRELLQPFVPLRLCALQDAPHVRVQLRLAPVVAGRLLGCGCLAGAGGFEQRRRRRRVEARIAPIGKTIAPARPFAAGVLVDECARQVTRLPHESGRGSADADGSRCRCSPTAYASRSHAATSASTSAATVSRK